MREKLTIEGPAFNDDTNTPHTEKANSIKLDNLNPEDLVPPALAKISSITGPIKINIKREGNRIEYIITDAEVITPEYKDFVYLDDRLDTHEGLKIGENRYARPIAFGTISEISPYILYCEMFETSPFLQGQGIGTTFQKHLAELAKTLGYKFMAGHQNEGKTARFFLNRGRYLLEEIKDEFQGEFNPLSDQEDDETVWCTVELLNPEDITKYIKPERVNTSTEDKINLKNRIEQLGDTLYYLSNILERIEKNSTERGDHANIIRIMRKLNQILPEKDQYDVSKLSQDDPNYILNLKVVLAHLKSKSTTLISKARLEELGY